MICMIYVAHVVSNSMIYRMKREIFQGSRQIRDLYDLAHHAAGWEPYNLHGLLGHASWVGSTKYRSCNIW